MLVISIAATTQDIQLQTIFTRWAYEQTLGKNQSLSWLHLEGPSNSSKNLHAIYCQNSYIFDFWLVVTIILQSVAIGMKKLLVDNIITACVKEMSPRCCMQSFKQTKNILHSLKMLAIVIS